MKKIILILFALGQILYAARLENTTWSNGETLLTFFEANEIPLRLYYNLQREEQELASEIMSGASFKVLRNDENKLEQALIPINEELQIHIFKNANDEYVLEFKPIMYVTEDRVLSLSLEMSPYNQIVRTTGSVALAGAFINSFKGNVDFKGLQPGDRLVVIYSQKRRMGRVFGMPDVKAAAIETNKKFQYTYQFNEKFYNKNGKELENFFLIVPLKYTRVSSKFSKKRFHPILGQYRAHLGIDYAAPVGTRVHAAGNGKVSFVGTQGGYGKVVKIQHGSNYTTLYGHLSGFSSNIRPGKAVRKGQVIGYVGNSGLSTGPHLHFGLYLNNRAINPNSVVRIYKGELVGNEKSKFEELKKEIQPVFDKALEENHINPPKEENFEDVILF